MSKKAKIIFVGAIIAVVVIAMVWQNHQRRSYMLSHGTYRRQLSLANDRISYILENSIEPSSEEWRELSSMLTIEASLLGSILESEFPASKEARQLLNYNKMIIERGGNKATYHRTALRDFVGDTYVAYTEDKKKLEKANINLEDYVPFKPQILKEVLQIRKELYYGVQTYLGGVKRSQFYSTILEAENRISEIISAR